MGPTKTASLKLLNGSYSPHAPKKVVQAVNFSNISLDLLGNIRITDFGQSFFAKDPPDGLGTPLSFFAPEMCFGIPPSKSSDIWALACLIFEIQSSVRLFPIVFDNAYIMLGTIVDVLGPFPENGNIRLPGQNTNPFRGGTTNPFNRVAHWRLKSMTTAHTFYLASKKHFSNFFREC